jgi:hypothetical protein
MHHMRRFAFICRFCWILFYVSKQSPEGELWHSGGASGQVPLWRCQLDMLQLWTLHTFVGFNGCRDLSGTAGVLQGKSPMFDIWTEAPSPPSTMTVLGHCTFFAKCCFFIVYFTWRGRGRWGKTVNLASRMQSTGVPGRIQVSELFYKSIMAVPGQQYTFEESHEQMCARTALFFDHHYWCANSLKGAPCYGIWL